MSRFRFRLEAVRKLRQRAEEDRAGDLAEAMSDAGSAKLAQEEVAEMERAGREQLKNLNGGVARMKCVQVMLDQLEHHHDEAREKRQEAEAAVRDRQEAFVHAVTERRAIERLKDRREKSWRQDEIRREQKATDEVNSMRHARDDGTESGGDRGGER